MNDDEFAGCIVGSFTIVWEILKVVLVIAALCFYFGGVTVDGTHYNFSCNGCSDGVEIRSVNRR